MHNLRILFWVTAALTLTSRLAFADGDPKKASPDLVGKMDDFILFVDDWSRRGIGAGDSEDGTPDPADCTALIAQFSSSTQPSDLIWNKGLKSWPGATYVQGVGWSVPFSEAPKICAQYASLRTVIAPMQKAGVSDPTSTPLPQSHQFNRHDEVADENPGTPCISKIEAAIADGAPHDVAVKFTADDPAMTLDQLRDKCTKFQADWEAAVTKIRADFAAENAAIRAVYSKVGIKGDRLQLFVDAGMPEDAGFLFAGCDHGPTTAAQMKKAKALFDLSEGDNGVTVTKWTFHGDKVTETSRTFDFKESAYAWCK